MFSLTNTLHFNLQFFVLALLIDGLVKIDSQYKQKRQQKQQKQQRVELAPRSDNLKC